MKKTAIIFGILFFPIISSAAPSISNVSGTLNNGNPITIIGNGFGTKSPATPLVWADFEGLSVDAEAAVTSKYSTSTIALGGANVLVATNADMPHLRSTRSVRAVAAANSPNINVDVSESGKVFVYLKRKFAHPDWFKTLTNYKFFRLWSSPENSPIDIVVGYTNFSSPFTYPYNNAHSNGTAEYGNPTNMYTTMSHPPANQWNTEEYQASKSTIDLQDGTFRFWYNGKKHINNTTLMNRSTKHPGSWSNLYIENYNHHSSNGVNDVPPSGAYVYYDDVYIDTTWSRVMIGNASTFDSCTHREPLIPTAWSSTSITAYFNQGSFQNGQSVYIFVVDSNGNASTGKAITIGGTENFKEGSVIPPSPPNKLIISRP